MGPAVIAGYRWLAGVALLIACSTANAQSYPAKPVRYIVPFPAAASPDLIARLITERCSRMWGQQVVVDNRAGAGGTLGAAYAAKQPPDGYTLFQCNIASSAIAESLYAKMPYDHPRDFTPIMLIGKTPNVLVVHPSLPARTVKEFIAYTKANPGKMSYGTSAAGSSQQLAMEYFKRTLNIDLISVLQRRTASVDRCYRRSNPRERANRTRRAADDTKRSRACTGGDERKTHPAFAGRAHRARNRCPRL